MHDAPLGHEGTEHVLVLAIFSGGACHRCGLAEPGFPPLKAPAHRPGEYGQSIALGMTTPSVAAVKAFEPHRRSGMNVVPQTHPKIANR